MIAVTGANGQLGRLVIKHLVEVTDSPVRALVRSPEKAKDLASDQVTVARADYNDPETLPAALKGVERLVLISGSEVGQRVPQHAAVISAAKQAGVGFIAYTSILNADTSSLALAREHKETEHLLKDSGIAHALLRNGWYVENYQSTVHGALAHGAVVGASGAGRISAAGREDYAEAAAKVVSGSDLTTRSLELAGQPGFTLGELAAELSAQTGRELPFHDLPEADYAGLLIKAAGLPEAFAAILADSDRGASLGDLQSTSTALEDLIGHKTKSLKAFVAETLAAAEPATA